MRGSEFYRRYIDKIAAVATSGSAPAELERKIEYVVRQFYVESLPMSRPPFRKLRDDMAKDLAGRAAGRPAGPARDAFAFAAELVRKQ